MTLQIQQHLAKAIIHHLDGNKEQFEQLVAKAMGIYKGVYGDGRRLHVPIEDILKAKGA